MVMLAVFAFDDFSVDIGELSWIEGEFDEQNEAQEYVVRWRERNGKVKLCSAKIMATGGKTDNYIKKSCSIWTYSNL